MRTIKQNKYWLEHYHDPKYEEIRNKILNSFSDLVFVEDGHRYYVGDRELKSVSEVTHTFKPHFDVEKMAQETYERNFHKPDSKYYQMTVDQIKESWKKISKDACEHGTARHNFGESLFYFMIGDFAHIVPEFNDRLKYDEITNEPYFVAYEPKEEAIIQVYEDFPDYMIPILCETKVYLVKDEFAYAGTFDILFYLENPDPKGQRGLYILDWKTNAQIFKHFGDTKLLDEFKDYDDTSYNIYILQLNSYQLALENIGLKVIARALFWLRPDKTYQKLKLENVTEKLYFALKRKGIC